MAYFLGPISPTKFKYQKYITNSPIINIMKRKKNPCKLRFLFHFIKKKKKKSKLGFLQLPKKKKISNISMIKVGSYN